ncbi:MAG: class I tRNA ligase family protein, partial [Leptospiraceae bacterium]|nr:class I tRNA ligase family protein [Leptospiraceae bacterium]
KFSKSLGNTIDPLSMMEKYGTDSFRFFLAASLPEARDILFDESRLEGYRGFCNKIWNSSRFIFMNLPEDFQPRELKEDELEASDIWIRKKFNECLSNYEKSYENYLFFDMAAKIYDFIWGDFCDWYLELTKPRIYGKVSEKSKEVALQNLVSILNKALQLLHPFMPFITEEINSIITSEYLVSSQWPKAYTLEDKENGFEKLNFFTEIVGRIRVVRSSQNITPDKKVKVIVKSDNYLVKSILEEQKLSFLQLVKGESLETVTSYNPEKSDSISGFSAGEIILPMSGLIDIEKEKIRLNKEKESLEKDISKIEKKIGNPEFLEKAKPEVVTKEKDKLEVLKSKLDTVLKGMEKLS